MKKLLLTLILYISVICSASAPPSNTLFIAAGTPIIYYDAGYYTRLIDALYQLEAGRNPFAFNVKEEAYGPLQIRPNRLAHYNKLTGDNYVMEDCFNFEISKKIFLYFTTHDGNGRSIPHKSWEQAAKNWNGSGPMTIAYWEKVKNLI